jgi:hypothetical protein
MSVYPTAHRGLALTTNQPTIADTDAGIDHDQSAATGRGIWEGLDICRGRGTSNNSTEHSPGKPATKTTEPQIQS